MTLLKENNLIIVLFDLGGTLVDQDSLTLIEDAEKTLSAIREMRDSEGKPLVLALISDYGKLNATSKEIEHSQNQYYDMLRGLGILTFFEPRDQRVTLSTEVNVEKPDEKIFRSAINKILENIPYKNVIYITELEDHIIAADKLGIIAIQFQGSGRFHRKINKLIDLIPLISQLLR
ncbi:MAG TPA: hypothetical protein VKA95_16250 [Nitrososphaeraceae archaeon]|nr:hypothetical protein [Nitrososphaeraceae archaeon]